MIDECQIEHIFLSGSGFSVLGSGKSKTLELSLPSAFMGGKPKRMKKKI